MVKSRGLKNAKTHPPQGIFKGNVINKIPKIAIMRILIIVFCMLIYSCSTRNSNRIFNIDDLGLTYKEAEKIGYKPVKGNSSVYHKVINDTIINLGFNRRGKSRIKEWVINLPNTNYNLVRDFLNKKQIIEVTSVKCFEEEKGYSFTSIGRLDNRIYICNVEKIDGIARLYIRATKPYSNEEVEENIRYYKDIYEKGFAHPDLSPSIEDED